MLLGGSVKEGDSPGGITDSSFEDGVQRALVVGDYKGSVSLEHRWTYSSSSSSSSKKAHDSLIEPKRPVGSLPSPRGGASETNDGQSVIYHAARLALGDARNLVFSAQSNSSIHLSDANCLSDKREQPETIDDHRLSKVIEDFKSKAGKHEVDFLDYITSYLGDDESSSLVLEERRKG
ncbi:hypothetical protein Tco_0788993 [Tanacetum coccineum]